MSPHLDSALSLRNFAASLKILQQAGSPSCLVHSSWPGAVVAPQALTQSVCRSRRYWLLAATEPSAVILATQLLKSHTSDAWTVCVSVRTCMLEASNRCQLCALWNCRHVLQDLIGNTFCGYFTNVLVIPRGITCAANVLPCPWAPQEWHLCFSIQHPKAHMWTYKLHRTLTLFEDGGSCDDWQ